MERQNSESKAECNRLLSPITDDRLNDRQCGHRSGVCPEDSRPQADGDNEGQSMQLFPFRLGETAFGADNQANALAVQLFQCGHGRR
ncbi:hypothetical protein D3C72_1939300 [compost metagenome]